MSDLSEAVRAIAVHRLSGDRSRGEVFDVLSGDDIRLDAETSRAISRLVDARGFDGIYVRPTMGDSRGWFGFAELTTSLLHE